MNNIRVTFLDKIDNEMTGSKEALDLFINLDKDDLIYSNTGYFQSGISDESSIILHFSILNKESISFRYDENIPNTREGKSWYTSNGKQNLKMIDAGDENYVPENSFLPLHLSLALITAFFNDPREKPDMVSWSDVNDFDD
ncbi:hypothetical protein [Chitinophaga arvensicola]|uniref:Immunity protein Imm1 n=1 Tax=Chitinophaga arvensicola TaxID=29529 RepID=A0A1I0S9N7_9BACT|nr:hypothetical protein [Chitinophaga arvensicola]SEW52897.1 hypothetical protein SAMN04488122_5219 [Chitinophaga arvensicola]